MATHHPLSKEITKNCESCDYYKEFLGNNLCVWGVTLKILKQGDTPKKCSLIHKELSENSIFYNLKEVEKIIKSMYKPQNKIYQS